MANTRYIQPDNNPTATSEANAAALAAGTAADTGGNKILGFGAPTPAAPVVGPSAPTSPPPSSPAITNDPIAQYYNNLVDPAVADQSVKDQIQKNMQAALDAIDQKYVSIYGTEAKNAENRIGETRAGNARSGTLGSDFGNASADKTVDINTQSKRAIDEAKATEQTTIRNEAFGQLNKLAADEIAARREDALGKAKNAQELMNKAMTDARDLIPKLAASGAQLTDAQKAVLQRNSGFDQLTFDSIYNAALPANQKGETTYHTLKKADGSETLLAITVKPDGTSSQKEYPVSVGGQVVKEYGGRPYVQTTDANGNIVLKPLAGFVQSSTDSINQQKGAFDLKVKQAPAQVANLKAAGYDYGQIAEYFQKQGIDPGLAEIDDALHRAFSSQTDYEKWKQAALSAKKASATDNLLNALLTSPTAGQ